MRRSCHLRHVIEVKIEGTRRRGRRRKQTLDGLKEKRGYRKLREEALWGTRFGKGYGTVTNKTRERINVL